MRAFVGIFLWVCCGIGAAGSFNADMRGEHSKLHQSPSEASHTQGEALAWGIMGGPMALVLSAGLSGGFYHGWTLTREPFPCTASSPEIWCKP